MVSGVSMAAIMMGASLEGMRKARSEIYMKQQKLADVREAWLHPQILDVLTI